MIALLALLGLSSIRTFNAITAIQISSLMRTLQVTSNQNASTVHLELRVGKVMNVFLAQEAMFLSRQNARSVTQQTSAQ